MALRNKSLNLHRGIEELRAKSDLDQYKPKTVDTLRV
jgi:hypothetical protein